MPRALKNLDLSLGPPARNVGVECPRVRADAPLPLPGQWTSRLSVNCPSYRAKAGSGRSRTGHGLLTPAARSRDSSARER